MKFKFGIAFRGLIAILISAIAMFAAGLAKRQREEVQTATDQVNAMIELSGAPGGWSEEQIRE